MKCWACKQDIQNPDTELIQSLKLDRNGDEKLNSKGQKEYYNYHKTCFQFKDHERKTQDALNQYLIDKFFTLKVPQTMWQYLIGFRHSGDKFNREKKKYQGYPFEVMHGSLLLVEDDLLGLYHKMQNENQFTDDMHKANLVIKYMCKNLDAVYGEYKLKQQKVKQQEVKKEIVNTATENTEFVAPKSRNKLTLNDSIT
jgi:hypothetical protein